MNANTVLLERLLAREELTAPEIEALVDDLVSGALVPELLAAVLTAWRAKGETPSEIAAMARALRRHARPFSADLAFFADCCGTGGDGSRSLNVSTAVGLLAAACGLPVVKHGNRAVSSSSGSADVCQALGIPTELTPEAARVLLHDSGFVFLHAPLYHTATARATPVRRSLGIRTIFNLLGPLTNPAAPTVQLVGVYDPKRVRDLAEALGQLGVRRALVVHGAGLDEIALHAATRAARLQEGRIDELVLEPQDAGLPHYPLDELSGGSPADNARALLDLFEHPRPSAYHDIVILNTAALLWIADLASDLRDAASLARAALHDGRALATLRRQQEFSTP